MHDGKDMTDFQRRVDACRCNIVAPASYYAGQIASLDAQFRSILLVEIKVGMRGMAAQTRHQAGASHGVPLIAIAASIEHQREFGTRDMPRRTNRRTSSIPSAFGSG